MFLSWSIFPSKCNTMVIRFDCCSTRIQNSVFLCRTPGLIKSISNLPSCLLFLDFGTYRKRVGITIAFSVYSSGHISNSVYLYMSSLLVRRCPPSFCMRSVHFGCISKCLAVLSEHVWYNDDIVFIRNDCNDSFLLRCLLRIVSPPTMSSPT